jgi:hypothetical protein
MIDVGTTLAATLVVARSRRSNGHLTNPAGGARCASGARPNKSLPRAGIFKGAVVRPSER